MDLNGVLVEDQKKDTLLYAGTFQVRITDWFFFKNKAELKYIGLENATINLNRSDSTWNYAFLEAYFASSPGSTKKKNAGIEFDLKKVVMKNVQFNMLDGWVGSDMRVKVKGLDMDARSITITSKTVDVSSLVLDDPYFSMLTYTGRRPPLPSSQVAAAKPKTEQEWKVFFGNVKINNGRFRNDRDNFETPLAYFDGRHLDFSRITGSLNNIGWTRDTISGNIDLSAKERSGLEIKALRAKTTFHPQAMIFDDLYLQTNNSVLGDYFAMRYDKLSDMNNFLRKVVMEANFDRATISSDDIAFFAPEVKSWNRNIRINGDAKGTVDAIASKDLEVWAGNDTYIHGAVSLVGLPNINETLINIEAQDLRTTYRDAASFIPAIRNITTPDLAKLSYVRFRGSYTGFINDFVTYGTLQTNLGTLQTDLNMKFPRGGEPSYSGSFSTDGFQLGAFLNNGELGVLAFNGKIKGRGFEWKTLDMDIDGTVRKIHYGDYTYQNITAKGNLRNRLFNGDFIMNDPNAQLSLQGLVDFRNVKPLFNVKADIGYANLKALQITPENFELAGKFDLNLEATSLSDLLGSARIYDASLTNDGKRLSFDSLVVSSSYENGLKRFKAISNEFDVDIRGDFDLKELPDAFTLFLSRYYPSYISAPRNVKPQVFEFDITTGVVEDYLGLIDKRLKGLNNSHIQGSLNTTANTMTVDADIPHFAFDQYDFTDIQLKGSGDLSQLILTGEVSNAQVGDSLYFPQTAFTVRANNDVSDIILNTTSNQVINQASLSAQVKTFSDGATIVLNPSTFILNGKTWNIEQGGELNFRKNTVVQGQVVLRESNQEIRLWTAPDDIGNYNNLHVAWTNINLGDISPLITKIYRFEGLVSGEAKIEDPTDRLRVSGTFNASELRVDNDSIGGFRGTIGYDNRTGLFTAKGSNTDPEHRVEVDVAMDFKDSADTFRDRVNAKFTNFQLKYLNRFLGSLFSEIDGYVTGNFDLLGEGSDRDYIAKAKLSNASFLVNFTQVKYWVDDTEFEMRKDIIDLDGIRVRDKDGRSALVTGFIRHRGFRDMYYDIKVETESDRMQLINTNENHNQQFYGKAWGGGTFVLLGPQEDMLMDINIRASTEDDSYITLPPAETRTSGQAGFMVERKYGREMTPGSVGLTSNLHYDVRLAANPRVQVEVVLDEMTRDAIRGRGSGNLQIISGTSEPLTIQGRYNIEGGDYAYSFQSLLKRPFKLRGGANNFIQWDGDPYEATVNIDAIYTAEDVSFAPLAGTVFNSDFASQRDDVNVKAKLTGNLFQPNFNFNLEFPQNNPKYSSPEFQLAVQQIENNQNELYKQVTYLIVFNSFAPFENTINTTGINPFGEFTYNTLSGLLFGKINEQLNKILSGILQNNNATLLFTGSLYNSNVFDQNARGEFRLPNQSLVNLGVGLPLFKDRAHFTIGATLDVPLGSDFQQSVRLFPDVTLELLVNKTGSVKATFFYRKNIDFLTGTGTSATSTVPRRYGASIGYGKEFDNLRELFRRNKKPVRDSLPAPAADSTNRN